MGLVDPGQLGQHFDVLERQVALTGGAQQVLAADPQRVAVLFGAGQQVAGNQVSTRADLLAVQGWTVPTTGYLEFVFSRHGPLPGREWFGLPGAMGAILNVMEVLLRRP